MQHVFIEGDKSAPTFLLLHGTGGNEEDLLGLGRTIDARANLLGVRGGELEQGMPRFFRRLGMGVFDLDNLSMRTKELAAFLNEAAAKYGFDRDNVIAIGYSNGANIAANLLFEVGKVVKGAILHHAMIPRDDIDMPDLTGVNVWIGAGSNDPMVPADNTKGLEHYLTKQGANVQMYWHEAGHQLTMDEVRDAKDWYDKTF